MYLKICSLINIMQCSKSNVTWIKRKSHHVTFRRKNVCTCARDGLRWTTSAVKCDEKLAVWKTRWRTNKTHTRTSRGHKYTRWRMTLQLHWYALYPQQLCGRYQANQCTTWRNDTGWQKWRCKENNACGVISTRNYWLKLPHARLSKKYSSGWQKYIMVERFILKLASHLIFIECKQYRGFCIVRC